jgi:hypothetical protein
VSESPEQIRKHIAVLSNFETIYREFVDALEKYRSGGEKTWSEDEYESRRRQILKDAVRGQKAMEASGVGTVAVRFPIATRRAVSQPSSSTFEPVVWACRCSTEFST